MKLCLGNCIETLKNMEEESVDLVVTDPPYPTTKRGVPKGFGGMCQNRLFNDGKVFKNNDIKPQEYLPELYRVLKKGSHCYVMTNHVNLIEMLNVAKDVGFHFVKCLIWVKDNKITGQCYMSQFEYILFLRKGKHRKINNCGTSDVLYFPNKKTKNEDGKNLHDTEKPVGLMEVLVTNSSNEGDVVLDPFMGIGSTGVACKNTDRHFIGIEIDEEYYNIALNRMKGEK